MNYRSIISKISSALFNPNMERVISKKVYINVILSILLIMSFIVLIINIILGFTSILYYTLFISFSSILLWLLNRLTKETHYTLILGFIFTLTIWNIFYFFNNGSYGPLYYYIFPIIYIIIYFSNKGVLYFLLTLILVNLIIVTYLEYFIPEIGFDYENNLLKLIDHYFGILITNFIIVLLFANLIKMQINEKKIANESNQLKTSFLANTSHDIRTPMNAIIGFVDLLEDPELSKKELNRNISIIHSNTNQLINLVNDIFDISIIQSGNFVLHKEFISLNLLIEELYSNFKQIIDNQGKEIIFQAHYGLPETQSIVFVDPVRINQILNNLIQNAIKHTQKGAIIFGYEYQVDSEELLFYVKDTGAGMATEKLNLIFSRYTTNIQGTKNTEGIGLGLNITSNLVELMKGKIWVKSEPEKGSQFYFTIPIEK